MIQIQEQNCINAAKSQYQVQKCIEARNAMEKANSLTLTLLCQAVSYFR